MRRSLILRWGIALAVIGSLLASGAVFGRDKEEAKAHCGENGGICGCAYGQVVCCDGSYAPRHYRSPDGRIVLNACNTATQSTGLIRTPTPHERYPSPSQEMYWRGSIFDR